jgi:hypothetical protein
MMKSFATKRFVSMPSIIIFNTRSSTQAVAKFTAVLLEDEDSSQDEDPNYSQDLVDLDDTIPSNDTHVVDSTKFNYPWPPAVNSATELPLSSDTAAH